MLGNLVNGENRQFLEMGKKSPVYYYLLEQIKFLINDNSKKFEEIILKKSSSWTTNLWLPKRKGGRIS